MWMPRDHLAADRRDDIAEIEDRGFFGHARMENDLQQEIAELVAQCGMIVPIDRIGHFVGFLDRVRRDRFEALLAIPRTTAFGIAQRSHDAEKVVDGRLHA